MNQNKLQKARPALGWMERAFLFYRIALVLLVIVDEDAMSMEMFAPAIWFNSGFHSLMTSLVSRFLSSFK